MLPAYSMNFPKITKRIPLAPRKSGEMDLWVQVCVQLSEPLPAADGIGPSFVGYFRNIGIRVPGPQPRTYLE